jgi:glycosyltransferase involved in cell wall biosynthesis
LAVTGEQGQTLSQETSALRPRSIAIVSKATAPGGGASRVAEDLTALLRADGCVVDHWVGFYSGQPRPGLRQLHGPRPLRPLVRLAHALSGRLGLPELLPAELAILGPSLWRYDAVHFHDLPGAVSPLSVLAATRAAPCLLTLHDCSFFTGGCIQPLDCPRFTAGCGQCPQLGIWPLSSGPDRTAVLARLKRWILRRGVATGRLHLVAPSRWMAGMLAAAGLDVPVTVIANGVDCHTYAPLPRERARDGLDLPPGRPVVLLLTGSLADRFKGIRQAAEALRQLPDPKPVVLAIGIPDPAVQELFAGLDIRFAGYISDRAGLARRIAAADVLLYPSLADNLPLTVLQAMACGLGTVSFATGGIPEMISHGVDGWLAPRGEVGALVEGLRVALDQGQAAVWGLSARDKAVRCFAEEHFLAAHRELYRRVCRPDVLPGHD